MRALLCVVLVGLGPVTEGAQRRPMGAVPPSQAVSTLTTATSLGLVAAGARTALDRGSSATRCVTGVAASLPGAAGASSDRVLPARATTCGIPQLVSRRCA